MNAYSYGSFIKVVTFMRAFCNLIVKSREKVTKSRTSHGSEVFFTDQEYAASTLDIYDRLDDINHCFFYGLVRRHH